MKSLDELFLQRRAEFPEGIGNRPNHMNKKAPMKSRSLTRISAITLFAGAITLFVTLATPNQLAAKPPQHSRYKLIDLGTPGGPTSFFSGPNFPILNNRGTFVGYGNTSTPNPNPNCFIPFNAPDCFVEHAFLWRGGALTDLGVLPGGTNSQTTSISASGLVVGFSENGLIDPLSGLPESRAVLWTKDGKIIDLGTLPGGTESFGIGVNSRGQVVGFASNNIPDAFGGPTQTRAFLWQNGVIQDLGTLGGPDASVSDINERGQVIGMSYTNSTPNATTGLPTQDPFLWENGTMVDIGTLGGTSGAANFVNSRGQVVGMSNLAGDQTQHPFLWDHGTLKDLGTLGGDNGLASWINDAGEVVGEADLPGSQTHDTFLWKNGVMTDLGNLGQTSFAYSINSRGQIVGHSKLADGTFHAFLWEKGGPMVDLNSLVRPRSDIVLVDPFDINDRGEIAVTGILPNGDEHAVLLIPCEENHGDDHADDEGCD